MIPNITISIDHGNRSIKTQNFVFPASYVKSALLPAIGGDVLVYKDDEYTLISQRMPQKTDKTKDDSYFNLTLFAIGKELAHARSRAKTINPNIVIDVTLLIGLPPLHCKGGSPTSSVTSAAMFGLVYLARLIAWANSLAMAKSVKLK